jgi:hypothetical protein
MRAMQQRQQQNKRQENMIMKKITHHWVLQDE